MSAYGFESHLPLPKEQRKGVALCLSGGGYRAALFHLGACRRLNELGALSRADTIVCVSGSCVIGTQLATHLARLGAWPEAGEPIPDWDDGVAEGVRAFTRKDARTVPALIGFSPVSWWNSNAATDALAAHYAAGPASARIADIPTHPRFLFLATDMQFRSLWVFDTANRVMGDEQAGYRPLPEEWTMARAAAASNCLPGVFPPVRVLNKPEDLVGGVYDGPDRDHLVSSIELMDGGVYDNMCVEPVWRDHRCLLVSDAGPRYKPDPKMGPIWKALRVPVTLMEQGNEVRKRWLISRYRSGDLEGTYWSIDSVLGDYVDGEAGIPVYSDRLIRDLMSQVRVDLDIFSEGEIAVLENHGYAMAELALQAHARELLRDGAPSPELPHPEWADEEKAAAALAESSRTKLFARGFQERRSAVRRFARR